MLSYIKYIFIFLTINLFASVNFTDPTTVTGDHTANLSKDGGTTNKPEITTNSTGDLPLKTVHS